MAEPIEPAPPPDDPGFPEWVRRTWRSLDPAGRAQWQRPLTPAQRLYLVGTVNGAPDLFGGAHRQAVAAAAPPGAPRPAPDDDPARPATRRGVVLTIKGSPQWKAWLDRAAGHHRVSTATLVERALADYTRRAGFPERPPQR